MNSCNHCKFNNNHGVCICYDRNSKMNTDYLSGKEHYPFPLPVSEEFDFDCEWVEPFSEDEELFVKAIGKDGEIVYKNILYPFNETLWQGVF